MSKDKKTLLEKLRKQRERIKKDTVLKVPKINKIDKKDGSKFSGNKKHLQYLHKQEDSIRKIFSMIFNLTSEDFINNDKIVKDGHKFFIKSNVNDEMKENSYNVGMMPQLKNKLNSKWDGLKDYKKTIWILKWYSNSENNPSISKFVNDMERHIISDKYMKDFNKKYLDSDLKYNDFIQRWKSLLRDKQVSAIQKQKMEEEKEEGLSSDDKPIRKPITKDKLYEIELMKNKLKGYEETLERLKIDKESRKDYLESISTDELDKITKNYKGYEKYSNKEQLIRLILNTEYLKDLNRLSNKGFKLKLKIHNKSIGIYIKPEKKVRELSFVEREYLNSIYAYIRNIELQQKTDEQLAMIASMYKSYSKKISNIVKISPDNRKDKIKYIKRYSKGVKPDVYNKLSESELQTYIDNINIERSLKNNKLNRSELIHDILMSEFSNVNLDVMDDIRDKDINIYDILKAVDTNKLQILGESYNINNINKLSRRILIQNIEKHIKGVSESFELSKQPKRLVYKEDIISEDTLYKLYNKIRKMSSEELKQRASMYNIIHKNVSDTELINNIFNYEKYILGLVEYDSVVKKDTIDRLTKITDKPKKYYESLSLNELESYLNNIESNKEYYLDKNLYEHPEVLKCLQLSKDYKWIDGRVTGVWLISSNNTKPDKKYITENIVINVNNKIFYLANRNYFKLQCNIYKNKRTQKGKILTCFDENGNPVMFKIGYTVIGHSNPLYKKIKVKGLSETQSVLRGFIIQDENIFNKEVEFKKKANMREKDIIIDILNTKISDKSKEISIKNISNTFKNVAPLNYDYGINKIDYSGSDYVDSNTPYMQILLDNILKFNIDGDVNDQTNRELYTKVANILVYLKFPDAKTFRKNIEKEYYLPDILPTLTPEEKFPEAFITSDSKYVSQNISTNRYKNIRMQKKVKIRQLLGDDVIIKDNDDNDDNDTYLNEKRKDVLSIIDTNIHKIVNKLTREMISVDTTKKSTTNPAITGFEKLIDTSNKLDYCKNSVSNSINDEDIVYYKDSVDDKYYCFSLDMLYNRIIVNNNIINPSTDREFDIKFVNRFSEMYNKRLSDDGFNTKYFQDKYDFDMEDIDADIQEDLDEKEEELVPDFLDILSDNIAKLENKLYKTYKKNKKSPSTKSKIKKKELCIYCNTHIKNDNLKSTIMDKNKSKIIKFCSIKCFEDKNDWKK